MDNKTLIKTLKRAGEVFKDLNPGDRDALAQTASLIEDALQRLPAEHPKVAESLALALAGAESLHQKRSSEQLLLAGAVGEIVLAAAELIDGGDDSQVDEACRLVAKMLGGDTTAWDGAGTGGSELLPELALPADADPDLLASFISESRDYIQESETALLALETEPDNMEAINTVFRGFHTIKGTSGFLDLALITKITDLAETFMSRFRSQEIRCTGGYAELALRAIDVLKSLVSGVQDALEGRPVNLSGNLEQFVIVLADPEAAGISEEQGAANLTAGNVEQTSQGRAESGSVESTVRVRTNRLDRLVDIAGELVIAQAMAAQDETVLSGEHAELSRKVDGLTKLVRELQDLSMSMRMVPLRPTFQKMTRLVRDLGHKSGKSVTFVTEGEETEIDRNLVDVVNDPLVHLLRNAVDHGVEALEERETSGKPRAGTVRLSASHSGDSVIVEIADDGRGLDREKIVGKAVERRLIESGDGLSDSDVFALIFEAGFSTADKVTDISGRGVGMDVVKQGIEVLRGRVDVSSEKGRGTTFTLRIPLTLAVTDGLLVKVGEQRFIVPTSNIRISFRPGQDALSTVAGRGELVTFQGETIPLLRLHKLFRIEGAIEDPMQGLLMILDGGARSYALLADKLLGRQQVVAKSLSSRIGKVRGVSSGAILGDGRVGLILDTFGIAVLARSVSAGQESVDPHWETVA